MSQVRRIDVNKLWKWVIEQVKAETQTPGLWRSMEAASPIVVEDDEVVLGFSIAHAQLRGLLLDKRHQRMIEQIIERGVQRKLRLRIIDGETLADWETHKENERVASELAQSNRAKPKAAPAVSIGAEDDGDHSSWEGFAEQVTRRISAIPTRNLPSVQGRVLLETVDALVEAYPRFMPTRPSEGDERAFSRTLDRVGERLGTPSAVLAYLVYSRLKQES
jgi:hypothetical protein